MWTSSRIAFPRRTSRTASSRSTSVYGTEPHHLHRLAQPGEVLLQPEGVELLVGLVPIGPQPLEDVRPVEHGGAVDGQHRRGLIHERAVHPDPELTHRVRLLCGVMTDVGAPVA